MVKRGRLSRKFDREWVFKICYAAMINKDSVQKNYDNIKDSFRFELTDFGKLYLKIMDRYFNSDDLIAPLKSNIEKVDYEHMSTMAKVLMQMAVAEMKFIIDIPVEVTINEIVQLAGIFIEGKEKRLINSILDKTYRYLEQKNEINIGYFLT